MMRFGLFSVVLMLVISPCAASDAPKNAPANTVGVGCLYPTISDAVAAVAPGSTILLEGGRDFYERLTITKDLTIRGGYAGCASASNGITTVDGEIGGIVITVFGDVDLTLEDVTIVGGANPSGDGGGIAFYSAIGGKLILDNVVIADCTALRGGGIWLGAGVELEAVETNIAYNTATEAGGGLRLYGARASLSGNSSIENNEAPVGGGVSGVAFAPFPPVLRLQDLVMLEENTALDGEGTGGAVSMKDGDVVLGNAVLVGGNGAIYGGGFHLERSSLTTFGSVIDINANGALADGGGIWAGDASTVTLRATIVRSNQALGSIGNGLGGGIFLSDSTCDVAASQFSGNEAQGGGAIFGHETSNLSFDAAPMGGSSSTGVRLADNHAVGGGALMLMGSTAMIRRAMFAANEAEGGGGAMALASSSYVTAWNSAFVENDSLGGAADAILLSTSSSMEGTGLTIANNDSGGGSSGRAISVSGDPLHSSLTLTSSIVWGHASSIEGTAAVSCSDVEGGWPGDNNLNLDPVFVDPASGEYDLDPSSPLVDRCATGGGPEDLFGSVRPWVVNNAAAPFDMGASETSAPRNLIFASSFEDGTTHEWDSGS